MDSSWLLQTIYLSNVESSRQRDRSRAYLGMFSPLGRPDLLCCFAPAADIPSTLYRITQFQVRMFVAAVQFYMIYS